MGSFAKRRRPFGWLGSWDGKHRINKRNLSRGVETLETRKLLVVTAPDWFTVNGSVESYEVAAVVSHDASVDAPAVELHVASNIAFDPSGLPLVEQLKDASGSQAIRFAELAPTSTTFHLPVGRSEYQTNTKFVTKARVAIESDVVYELRADSVDSPFTGELEIGVLPLDADNLAISPIHVRRFGGAKDTVLLQPIFPGDTSIVVANATGWSNAANSPAQTRTLAWFGYHDSTGTAYADFTYTRNTLGNKGDAAWSAGGITADAATGGNRIALTRPWSGPAVTAGTAIRNAVADDSPFQLVQHIYDREKDFVFNDYVQHGQLIQVQALIGGPSWNTDADVQSALPVATKSIVITSSTQLNNLTISIAGKSSEAATFSGLHRVVAAATLQSVTADLPQIIDVGRATYLGVTASVKTTTAQPAPVESHSIGYEALDSDGQVISSAHVVRHRTAVDTTLAVELKPGDTQIVLTDGAGWSTQVDAATRTLAWYGYQNSRGETYPDYTYTRNVAGDPITGLWPIGGIVGNTITLNKPWAGPKLLAGAAVRNAVDGSTLQAAILSKSPLPITPIRLNSAAISGVWQNGVASGSAFPPGTSAIRPAAILNETDFVRDDIVVLESFTATTLPTSLVSVTPALRQHVLLLDVIANDPIVQNRPQVVLTSISNPLFGTAVITSGKIRYTGPANFIGIDRFSYTLSDATSGESWTEQISVAITGGNHDQDSALVQGLAALQAVVPSGRAPVAADDYYRPNHYRVASGSVLLVDGVTQKTLQNNDDYALQNPTRGTVYGLVDAPRHGSLRMNPDGTFIYFPNTDYSGIDSFRYFRFDGLRIDTAVAQIEVFKGSREFVADSINLLVLGMLVYHSNYNQFPVDVVAPADPTKQGVPRLSWRVHVLPSIGYGELYQQFHLDEPWDSPHNLPLSAKMPNIFGDGLSVGATTTRIQALTGPRSAPNGSLIGGVGLPNDGTKIRIRDILDGTSNTILLVQTSSDRAVPWTAPQEAEFNYANPLDTVGQIDSQGILVGMFSGDVHSLPADISSESFTALATRYGFPSEPIVDIGTIERAKDSQAWDAGGLQQDRNFETIGTGLQACAASYGSLPNGFPQNPDGTRRFSWRVYLLPFIGQKDLWDRFNTAEPWDSPHNLALLPLMPDIFRSMGDPANSLTTRIQIAQGPGMAYHVDANGLVQPSLTSDFVDGLSNTLTVVEIGPDRTVLWTAPDEFDFNPADPFANLGDLSAGFFRALKADGQLVKLPSTLAPDLLTALFTRNATTYYGTGSIPEAEYLPLDSMLRRYDDLNAAPDKLAPQDKLKQIGLGFHRFHAAYNQLPIANQDAYYDANGKPFLSWRVHLLPFLGYQILYNKFHLNEPWDSPNNLPLLQFMPDVLRDNDDAWDSTTTRIQEFVDGGTPQLSYKDGALFRSVRQKVGFRNILDGTANTILVIQSGPDVAVPWTKPADITFDLLHPYHNVGQIGDGFNVVSADGAVNWKAVGPDKELVGWVRPNDRFIIPYNELQSTISKNVISEGNDLLAIESTIFSREKRFSAIGTGFQNIDIVVSDPTLLEVSPTHLTFAAGDFELPHRITVRAIDNRMFDGPRTATISIAGQSIEISVLDNDLPPSVVLSRNIASIVEASGTVVFSAVLSAASGLPVTVNLGFTGTATLNSDYTRTGTQIIIAPGQKFGSVTVTAVQDTLDEANETILVNITSVINGAGAGAPQSSSLIVDDDVAPSVTLTRNNATIAENAATSVYTATLSAVSGQAVTVALGFTGTATVVTDYSTVPSIVIPAGESRGIFTITAVQDTRDEADETAIVSITGVTNGMLGATTTSASTIIDDDLPPSVVLSRNIASIVEASGTVVFSAVLSAASGLPVTVNLGFTGTATLNSDYTRTGTQVIIAPGQKFGSVTVTAVQDTLDEANETILVNITSVINGAGAGALQSSLLIVDDDLPPTVTLARNSATIAENAATSVYTATLSAVSGQAVTVSLGFTGTATAGTDYTTTATSLVIPAGQTTGTFTVKAVQDTRDEADETAIVSITGATNATLGVTTSATTTITDDDLPPTVFLSRDKASIGEAGGTSGTVVFSAFLTAASGLPVTVNLAFTGTATFNSDYSRTGTQIIIAPGATSGSVTVTSMPDTLDEASETILVDITSVTNGNGTGAAQSSSSIVDDDVAPSVTLSRNNATIAENLGVSVFTATLSAASGQAVTINLGFSGTATLTNDYTRSNTQIIIAAGSTTGTITVTAVQDLLDELDESVFVEITSVINGTENGIQSATTTIIDDDV